MGMQAKHDIDRHNLRVQSNVPAREIMSSPELRNLENNYRNELEHLATTSYLDSTPSWYYPTATPEAEKSQEKRDNTGGSLYDRILQEQEARRNKQP
jgi:hypothetical protein